jgi:phosphoribosylformylglycinamidine cyclo-ligase
MTTYRDAGVDLNAADELIDRIGSGVVATWNDGVVGGFGGFAAGIRIPPGYRSPVLMMSTDGVGTKADLARASASLGGLGWDLLAMVVDDLAAAGATPIAVQDYVSVGRLNVDRVAAIIDSIAAACTANDVALLGGETAEHPGILDPDQFDIAATALGVVEEGAEIDGSGVVADDVLIGVASPNLRSNGFSLVRAVIADRLALDEVFPGDDRPTAEVLLEPSVVYAPSVVETATRTTVHGLVHVTGGGLPGNVVRILPEGTRAMIDASRWDVPNVFRVLQRLGDIADGEMFRVFNMGIGFVIALPEDAADRAIERLESFGHQAAVIGRVTPGDRGVEIG